jgi:hypothetical protein
MSSTQRGSLIALFLAEYASQGLTVNFNPADDGEMLMGRG